MFLIAGSVARLGGWRVRRRLVFFVVLGMAWASGQAAMAANVNDYHLAESFTLPGSGPMDVLADGRIVTVTGTTVNVETTLGSRQFEAVGVLSGADFPGFGAAFVKVSPSGDRLAIGNNGGGSFSNFQVGVFATDDLSGQWHPANHFDAVWMDDRHLALTGGAFGQPAFVSVLDTSGPGAGTNTIVVNNIGGAPAGVAIDSDGRLYTGNGFATTGPSETGAIKAFALEVWMPSLTGAAPADFEVDGALVTTVLSAASLGFDHLGDLFVGGGDFGGGDVNFAAILNASSLADSLAGLGPIDSSDPLAVRRLDPDALNSFNSYDATFNDVTQQLYVRQDAAVYSYVLPEPASLVLLLGGMTAAGIASVRRWRL